MRPEVLVVGGAGYIGSHTCLALAEAGFAPIVFDNLSSGHREFVQWGPLIEGDLGTPEGIAALDGVLGSGRIVAVVHFAALIEVAESVRDPLSFYSNNVANTISLLAAMRRAGVRNIVFSSTCATYGDYRGDGLISETTDQRPINPYGRTKAVVEGILGDMQRAGHLDAVVLRYFNAAGSDPEGRIGEWHPNESHLIPLAIRAARDQGEPLTVFRSPSPTPDGTCVRDYVHVMDLAEAHVAAVRRLVSGGGGLTANVGTGKGTSVLGIIGEICRVGGVQVPHVMADPRPGDAPVLVADAALAARELGFATRRSVGDIIESAWRWHVDLRPDTV